MPRIALQKKTRFEVFKRDGFKCQYCGNCPPNVVLQVDHINPVANGGENDIDNLITACFDCNSGKSDRLLGDIPQAINEKLEVLKEKESQLKEFNKYIKKIKDRMNKHVQRIDDIFSMYFPDRCFSETFKASVRNNFLSVLPLHEVEDAIEIACLKGLNADKTIRYFCGICWNKIKVIKQCLEQEI